MNNIIAQIEQDQMKHEKYIFRSGDLVEVKMWVIEGNKKRLQIFEGIIIAIRNSGINSTFTVRKISNGEGIERLFKTYSSIIENVTVKRHGDVRKAKLYYLRQRIGKSARIKERLNKNI